MKVSRLIDLLLLIVGVGCLGTFVMFTIQAKVYQNQLDASFEYMARSAPHVAPTEPSTPSVPKPAPLMLREGDLVGRLEIPRLDLSVMVMEGVASRTLRLGAGHIPGTPFPGRGGNTGIAAHRDSFFRALSNIHQNDRISFRTVEKNVDYRVVSTEIVTPDDVSALSPTPGDTLTLVTCYPFYYIGPAPKRFIVKAVVDSKSDSQ